MVLSESEWCFFMSISPITSSNMSMYAAAASGGGVDTEYELIKRRLMALGIAPSGNKEADKTKLEVAIKVQNMQNSKGSMSARQSIPFDDIMGQLNLTISGDIDKDYNTTIDKLDYKIGLAGSDEEKQRLQDMKTTVESEYNSSKQSSMSNFTGASQLSAMNRYMML